LAGGKGSRLAERTRSIPKPMVEVAGQPFLGYLLSLLKQQGIEEVILLTGYLGEVIHNYVGDGAAWGLRVQYSHSAIEDETGRRLALATDSLYENFLLMYADVYWPLPLQSMADIFTAKNDAVALVAAYANRDGITRDNLQAGEDGQIQLYDKTRSAPGLTHVDSGYLLCNRRLLDFFPDDNFSLEKQVYPRLVEDGLMYAFSSEHRHYSIDTVEKVETATRFFNSGKTILLDRDGTINRAAERWQYISNWDEFEFLDGALEALQLLKRAGYRLVVVSNQAGIARGMVTHNQVDDIHARLQRVCMEHGCPIDAFYYCPHGWDEGCFCRKPSPGLLFWAANEMAFDLEHAVMIGDNDSDMGAAENAGVRGIRVDGESSLLDASKILVGS